MNPFSEEDYPKHIKYVLNTPKNILELYKIFGCSKARDMDCKYLEINLDELHWWYSPDFAWLYRNQPSISDMEDIILLSRIEKIKKIKDGIK